MKEQWTLRLFSLILCCFSFYFVEKKMNFFRFPLLLQNGKCWEGKEKEKKEWSNRGLWVVCQWEWTKYIVNWEGLAPVTPFHMHLEFMNLNILKKKPRMIHINKLIEVLSCDGVINIFNYKPGVWASYNVNPNLVKYPSILGFSGWTQGYNVVPQHRMRNYE